MQLTAQQEADLLRRANDMRSDICDTCAQAVQFHTVRLDVYAQDVKAVGRCGCHRISHAYTIGTFIGLGIRNT